MRLRTTKLKNTSFLRRLKSFFCPYKTSWIRVFMTSMSDAYSNRRLVTYVRRLKNANEGRLIYTSYFKQYDAYCYESESSMGPNSLLGLIIKNWRYSSIIKYKQGDNTRNWKLFVKICLQITLKLRLNEHTKSV